MSELTSFLHDILGDTHKGRLIDKLGNFATENYGDKGLQFFNTLTTAQVIIKTQQLLFNFLIHSCSSANNFS